MKRAYLIFYVVSLASFFAGTIGLSSIGNLRFALIGPLLVISIVKSAKFPTRVSTNVLFSVWMFLSWCLLSCFWSENFLLSIVKLALFATTILAFLLGGMLLAEEYPDMNPYLPLAPIFCYVVIGSVLRPAEVSGNLQGVVGNSNMLGASILFTLPWYLTELYRKWSTRTIRRVLFVLGGVALVVLVLSRSRTMMLGAIATSLLLFRSLKVGRKIALLYAFMVFLVLVLVVNPDILSTIQNTYVLKSGTRLMQSREDQMKESLDFAKKGGAIGAGFGVSVGIAQYWTPGETFSDYSREKGNSILAIVEEIGVLGLVLWLLMFLFLFAGIRALTPIIGSDPGERFVYLLTLGYLLAIFVSSMAEAWVLSPGPETAVAWATFGISIGVLKRGQQQHAALVRSA